MQTHTHAAEDVLVGILHEGGTESVVDEDTERPPRRNYSSAELGKVVAVSEVKFYACLADKTFHLCRPDNDERVL